MVSRKSKQSPVGRYSAPGISPPGYEPPRRGKPELSRIPIAEGAVPDPYDSRGGRIKARISQANLLDKELQHGRISQAAFDEGRRLEKIFEPASNIRSPDMEGSPRSDPWEAHEMAVIRKIEVARQVGVEIPAEMRDAGLGDLDIKILYQILDNKMDYRQCGSLHGAQSARGAMIIADRFRRALETYADFRSARGADRSRVRAWQSKAQEDSENGT